MRLLGILISLHFIERPLKIILCKLIMTEEKYKFSQSYWISLNIKFLTAIKLISSNTNNFFVEFSY